MEGNALKTGNNPYYVRLVALLPPVLPQIDAERVWSQRFVCPFGSEQTDVRLRLRETLGGRSQPLAAMGSST
ncbi:hypothetical protein DFR29_104139 [Tahibacter aquaticus]|uniref:Uncharacterized protein n=1 Tax=Tahibacter aquaticus TaxID=520092 RepID=A0A4R6Z2A6_9GAMM|nr:hypothetical protein DFR29_104139 [Tahibacter aquaticus]